MPAARPLRAGCRVVDPSPFDLDNVDPVLRVGQDEVCLPIPGAAAQARNLPGDRMENMPVSRQLVRQGMVERHLDLAFDIGPDPVGMHLGHGGWLPRRDSHQSSAGGTRAASNRALSNSYTSPRLSWA